jgi:hypothetical protein
MTEPFTVEFLYGGVKREIPCTLRHSAYTYQFLCQLGDAEIIIEKDDEGRLRAMESDPFSSKNKKADPALVRVLLEEMERILL